MGDSQKIIKDGSKLQKLQRSSRISRKERIRNVTIRQQIGLEEPVVKEVEQNQLTWDGMSKEWQKEDYPKQH